MFTDDQGQRKETADEMSIERKLDLILVEVKQLHGAFAKKEDGSIDFDGHRQYHEQMIEAAKEQAKFWRDLRIEIAKKGIFGLTIIVCGLILAGITAKTGIVVK